LFSLAQAIIRHLLIIYKKIQIICTAKLPKAMGEFTRYMPVLKQ
jgi:hypothetical protein